MNNSTLLVSWFLLALIIWCFWCNPHVVFFVGIMLLSAINTYETLKKVFGVKS